MCNKLCVIFIFLFVFFNLKFLMKCFSCALALEMFLFCRTVYLKMQRKNSF